MFAVVVFSIIDLINKMLNGEVNVFWTIVIVVASVLSILAFFCARKKFGPPLGQAILSRELILEIVGGTITEADIWIRWNEKFGNEEVKKKIEEMTNHPRGAKLP